MGNPIFFGHNQAAGGGPSGPVALSDDFNRANSSAPGGLWTQVAGNCDIASNQLVGVTSNTSNIVRHGTPVGGLTQYQKATLGGWGSDNAYLTFIFRWGAANNGPSYGVTFHAIEDQVSWSRYSNTSGGSYTDISTQAVSVVGGDEFGVTIEGLGSSTVVRVWRNCTGLPVAANNWNGDTSPTLTFTTNPPTPVDTGDGLGLDIYPTVSSGAWVDNWFGGAL